MKLLFAERRECGKALALARRIDHEYAEAAEKRKAEQRTFTMPDVRPGDPARACYSHLDNIRRHLTIEDYSRVDAMIALRMRANGHSQEAVEETIRDAQTGRNWQRYPKEQRITPSAPPVTGIWRETSDTWNCGGRSKKGNIRIRAGLA